MTATVTLDDASLSYLSRPGREDLPVYGRDRNAAAHLDAALSLGKPDATTLSSDGTQPTLNAAASALPPGCVTVDANGTSTS